MAQPEVYWTWTPSHLTLLPDSLPNAVPSPAKERTLRAPFGIDKDLYNFALRPEIPLVCASIYLLTVFSLNAYNRRHKHAPWAISKTSAFGYFVVVHNILLALYSFATFAAMGRAIALTLPPWDAENWNVRVADGLCKLHGPRGLGDAATFNTTINIWEVKNTAIHLTGAGVPDPTDVGRLWNEGLAFWGWLFYVSKFYEVLDTLIVLAKGKRSGTLQTYHHAGAMLCMWAGIRYMSPPIWMFVFVNSGIHALMYTYFTLSALGYKVPQGLKRTLTILQIGQFIWGASYAAAHLFIQYDIPITVPFQVAHAVQRAASSASSVAKSATSAVSEVVETPTAAAAFGTLIKKLLLRAAGEEGVAERIALQPQAQAQIPILPSGPAAQHVEDKVHHWIEHRYETKYRTDWTRINCIDTTGEAFAIYLNLLYLSPLTWLFLRFFSRAYSQRGRPRSASQALHEVALSAQEARRETERSFEEVGEKIEEEVEKRETQVEQEVRTDVTKVKESWREGKISEDVKQVASDAEEKVKESSQEGKVSQYIKQVAADVEKTVESFSQDVRQTVETATKKTEESTTSESSSTWIRGGGGLFRRSWTDDEKAAGMDTEESEEKQDENLEASQPIRPDPEEDTDAMGKSGAIVEPSDDTNW